MENFNWEVYLEKYPDLKNIGINNKFDSWMHYCKFGRNEGRSDNYPYILLYDRPDRLGANITNYMAQILYAYHNKYYIKIEGDLKYNTTPFVKALFNFIEEYNKDKKHNFRIVYGNTHCYTGLIGQTTQTINSDYFTYFKRLNIKLDVNYPIPFDVSKTILIHLRLDDVAHCSDYNGSICTNFYKNKVENKEYCFYTQPEGCNRQAPLSDSKIISILNEINQPDYTVKIITTPNSIVTLPYEVITTNDESHDLYLLTKCKIVILSRSTFSLSSLFFGDHQTVYIPSWGHSVCLGLNTKFDKTNFKYFY